MKKTLAILLAVVMALSLMAACGSTANTPAAEEPAKTGEAAPAKTIVLKLGHNSNAESMYNQGCEKFAQLVEEYTNGTVKVETAARSATRPNCSTASVWARSTWLLSTPPSSPPTAANSPF